jgi:hypothetical protein
MATTGSNFALINGPSGGTALDGAASVAFPFVSAQSSIATLECVNSYNQNPALASYPATPLDRVVFDAALGTTTPGVGSTFYAFGKFVGGFAKNGVVYLAMVGTTPQSVNLTNTALNTPAGTAGDTVFANVGAMVFNNVGAVDLTISPGASNPSRLPTFGGTTPTLIVPAGGVVAVYNPTTLAVDSSHNLFTVTPTAGGALAVTVMGS